MEVESPTHQSLSPFFSSYHSIPLLYVAANNNLGVCIFNPCFFGEIGTEKPFLFTFFVGKASSPLVFCFALAYLIPIQAAVLISKSHFRFNNTLNQYFILIIESVLDLVLVLVMIEKLWFFDKGLVTCQFADKRPKQTDFGLTVIVGGLISSLLMFYFQSLFKSPANYPSRAPFSYSISNIFLPSDVFFTCCFNCLRFRLKIWCFAAKGSCWFLPLFKSHLFSLIWLKKETVKDGRSF